jgi:hypothetical protein
MAIYVIVDDTKRTAGVTLNPRCYQGLIDAQSKKQAALFCPPHHSLVTLSTLPSAEQRKIRHSLGNKVTICANVIVPPQQPHGGKRAGSGRKPIPAPDRPMCCGKPTYRHTGGRWRCSICKSLYKIPIRMVDNQAQSADNRTRNPTTPNHDPNQPNQSPDPVRLPANRKIQY